MYCSDKLKVETRGAQLSASYKMYGHTNFMNLQNS